MKEKNVVGKAYSLTYKLTMMSFVVSLGLGNSIQIANVKLVYITTFILLFLTLLNSQRFSGIMQNAAYRRIVIFGIGWLVYPLFIIFNISNFAMWVSAYRTLILNFLSLFLIVQYIRNKNDWMLISKSVIFLQAIMLIIGYWEILTGNHLRTTEIENFSSNAYQIYYKKPFSFYGNVNDNSSVLFLCLIILIIYYLENKKNLRLKWIYILMMMATIHQIMVIGARGIIYSIPVMCVITIYFLFISKLGKFERNVFYMLCLYMALGIIILMFLLHPPSYYIELFTSNGNYIATGNYSSDLSRLRIIKDGFRAFIGTLGLGLGPGQSIVASGINLHNFYLEILFEYGVFFGGVFIYSLFRVSFMEKKFCSDIVSAIVKSIPFVFLLLGISSSHLVSIKMTWVVLSLIFCLRYNCFITRSFNNKRILFSS